MTKLKLALAAVAEKLIGIFPLLWRMELFRVAARSIGVKYAGFPGKQGIFEAPVYDRIGSSLYVSQGAVDTGTCELLKGLFKEGTGTLIDVGANIGMICIPTKRAVPGIEVYAIEPDSDNCECLRVNAFRAGVSDIKVLNRAAYRREGLLDFERSSDNAGDHRIRSARPGSGKELYRESARAVVQVPAATLDSMIPISGLKRPVVLKCDVQGAEADVLAGAPKLLSSVEVMFIEFWPYGLKRTGANVEELLSAMSGFPFGGQLDPMNAASIHLRPIRELTAELKRIYTAETGVGHWDLVLSRKGTLV